MNPNFDDQLSMKNHGRTIAAGGPCNWLDDDEWAEIKDVTVTQDRVVASSGGRSTTVRRDTDPDWWLGADNAVEDPGTTDPGILDKAKINAFGYSVDPQGTQVPRAAHIRKVYPRDHEASSKELSERPRIIRRGVPFGQSFRHGNPPDSPFGADPQFPNDRGLCFVCYQRSIRDQFELIQCTWMNQESVPESGDGVDPVASQASTERWFRVPGGAADSVTLPKQWVTTTGGEYFFSPSIRALKQLSKSLS